MNGYFTWLPLGSQGFYITYCCVVAGVIDEDYRGNVGVLLFNHSDTDFQVNPGDRVAQLICEKISYPELKELEVI